MSDVLFAAAVARRSGIDVETADKVIVAMSGLIRDMALAGSAVRLAGVGSFEVRPPRPGGTLRALTFRPVARLARIASAAP
jgi:nucleoid DNA-binding protein